MAAADSILDVIQSFRSRRSTRALLILVVGLVWLAAGPLPPIAHAQESEEPEPFAALTVRPNGAEIFDIGTGTTTLPDGGVVVDAATEIRLSAPFIRLQEGVWLEARAPVVHGPFGELTATGLALNLAELVLDAEGPLTFAREGLALEAEGAHWDGEEELVSFASPTSASAGFSAARILLDPTTGNALLVGPYRYEDGMFTLSSDEEGALLALIWSVVDDIGGYDARTEVPEELLERFAPLLIEDPA